MPTGEVTSWYSDKGFGFIKPDDGGEDVFCHVTGLLDGEGSVRQGDQVKYKMSFDDRKGKDRAEKVERVGGGGGRSRSRSRGGGRDRGRSDSRPRGGRGGGGGGRGGGGGGGTKQGPGTGEVLRWHGEKGFGFIKPDDGGEDIFCHVSGLKHGEGSVREGDQVTYVVRFDDRKGKDRAEDVEVAGGGGGGRGGGRGRDSRSPPPRRRDDSRRR